MFIRNSWRYCCIISTDNGGLKVALPEYTSMCEIKVLLNTPDVVSLVPLFSTIVLTFVTVVRKFGISDGGAYIFIFWAAGVFK